MSRVDLLRNVSFFARASDQDLEALAGHLGRRTFGKGMIIFHKGGVGQTLYIIESGKVRIFILSETGQEISVNVYGPGDVFGELALLDGLPRSAGAMAMEKTVTLTLHREDFLRHLETCPSMARGIMEVLSARVRYTTAYAESLSFLDVYGRVAAKLLELADRYGHVSQEGTDAIGGIEIDLRLTQTELATWVAATRESVNKVLGTFRDQGLIALEGQRIVLIDRPGLEHRISY
jgi:CRP/FNR family transcriptional regulator/CRP/FNR family cyclic AMP-dependent transcriptional regulator